MTCFAKLVVPRQEILPLDILCNVGVLRREKAPDNALVPATPAMVTFPPRPKQETEAGQCEYGRCRSGVWQQQKNDLDTRNYCRDPFPSLTSYLADGDL